MDTVEVENIRVRRDEIAAVESSGEYLKIYLKSGPVLRVGVNHENMTAAKEMLMPIT